MPDGAFIAVSLVGRRSVARMLLGGPATAHPLLGYSGARPKHAPHAPPRFWGSPSLLFAGRRSPTAAFHPPPLGYTHWLDRGSRSSLNLPLEYAGEPFCPPQIVRVSPSRSYT